jgi:hypothetical protein
MPTNSGPPPPSDLSDSPLYWLAVMRSARTSGDALLERHAHARLAALGVQITFGDDLCAPARQKPHKPRHEPAGPEVGQ